MLHRVGREGQSRVRAAPAISFGFIERSPRPLARRLPALRAQAQPACAVRPRRAAAGGARGLCGCGRRRRGRRARSAIAGRERFFDRHQLARVHQPQQPDLQVQARLQRGLQIAEQVERQLQVARQILFGKAAPRSRPAVRCSGGDAAIRRSFRAGDLRPPAGCGSSAPARARNAAGAAVALQLVDHFEHARGVRLR